MKSRPGTPLARRLAMAWRILKSGGERSDYSGSVDHRLTMDWVTGNLHPDDEVRKSARKLRARARDLAKNNGYVRRWIKLSRNNVIGPYGMTLQPRILGPDGQPDEQSTDVLKRHWKRWSKQPVTVDGTTNRIEFEKQVFNTFKAEGEVFVRMVDQFPSNEYGFALQAIDADLLDETYNVARAPGQNEIRMGIEIDQVGRRVAYHFWTEHPYSLSGTMPQRKRVRYPASEILHIYRPDRVNQTRGVTELNSVMMTMRHLDMYEEAELIAARISASKMGFFEKQNPGAPIDASKEQVQMPMDANPASFEILNPGYTFKEWNPDHPSTAFGPFIKAKLRKFASALGAAYNAIANDLEGVNMSSLRVGRLDEQDDYMDSQEFWDGIFETPIYTRFVANALLAGKLPLASRDPSRYTDADFQPRGWKPVDELKSAMASILRINNRIDSQQSVMTAEGAEPETVLGDIKRFEEMAKEKGVPLLGGTDGVPLLELALKMATQGDKEDAADSSGSSGSEGRKSILTLTGS